MANIEIRAVENLAGTSVPYAYAVKAGPWLFLTGHEAFDFATGHAPEVEGHAGFPSYGAPRLKREAEYILKRVRATLAEFGSDFKPRVRVGGKRRKEVLKVDLPAMSSYGPCIRAGELVFASGLTALGADGHVIGKDQCSPLDALAHSAQVQAHAVLNSAERLCKAAGTG